jgi:hypothetical protein
MVYLQNGIQLSHNKNELCHWQQHGWSQRTLFEGNKPDPERQIPHVVSTERNSGH